MVSDASPTWQHRALERSLAGARSRADDQLTRLLRAAQSIISEEADLTVPFLVARAGMSTKTFYRHFASRDDLLLAVLEEELSIGAHIMARAIDAHQDPVGRFKACVHAYVALPRRYPNARVRMTHVQDSQRLMALYPEQAARCNAPITALFDDGIGGLVEAGLIQLDDPELTARSIFHLLTGHLVEAANDPSPDVYERIEAHAWNFCRAGLNLEAEAG
jgi:TetR/AcrR family transcriptional regulator